LGAKRGRAHGAINMAVFSDRDGSILRSGGRRPPPTPPHGSMRKMGARHKFRQAKERKEEDALRPMIMGRFDLEKKKKEKPAGPSPRWPASNGFH